MTFNLPSTFTRLNPLIHVFDPTPYILRSTHYKNPLNSFRKKNFPIGLNIPYTLTSPRRFSQLSNSKTKEVEVNLFTANYEKDIELSKDAQISGFENQTIILRQDPSKPKCLYRIFMFNIGMLTNGKLASMHHRCSKAKHIGSIYADGKPFQVYLEAK